MTQNQQGEKIKMSNNKASRILTRDELLSHDPCFYYRDLFTQRFPVSVEVTVELAVSQAQDWDWHFAAGALLDDCEPFRAAYHASSNEYEAVMAPYVKAVELKYDEALMVYRQRRDALVEGGMNYYDACNEADMAYEGFVEVERAAREAVRLIASRRLNEALARSFAELYIAEGEAVGGASYEAPEPDPEEGYESDDETCYCGCNG